jgi:hypothetical protein
VLFVFLVSAVSALFFIYFLQRKLLFFMGRRSTVSSRGGEKASSIEMEGPSKLKENQMGLLMNALT